MEKISLEEWCKKNNREFLLKEWDYEKNGDLTPKDVSYGSHKKVWWKCIKCGYERCVKICDRALTPSNCPVCANLVIIEGYNDLKTYCINNNLLHLIAEFNEEKTGFSMSSVPKGTDKKAWWKCLKCGNEWKMRIANRALYNCGCPNCKKKIFVIKGSNDLKTYCEQNNYITMLNEWDYIDNYFLGVQIDTIPQTFREKVWWLCSKCKSKYYMSPYVRINEYEKRNKCTCPNCKIFPKKITHYI